MDIPYKVRQEMNKLSKEVFGVSSKWQQILKKGTQELQTKKVTEVVPGENGAEPTTKEFTVAALNEHGQKIFKTKRYTLEDVRTIMENAIKSRDAALAKQQAEQERRQLEQDIQNQAAGGTGI